MHRRIFIIILLIALIPAGCGRALLPESRGAHDTFLDDLQRRTFGFFWDLSNPENGLTPDRWPTESFSSVAAIGFALTAYGVGVEREYVTRQEAAHRTLTTLRFLWHAPQGEDEAGMTGHMGHFYHFLEMDSGHRFGQVELSTIDTALLMAGVLFASEYFNANNEDEHDIRAYADSLYRRVDWQWAQPRPPLVTLGWHPESDFLPYDYGGYSEAMILYLLALGSPTHPIDEGAWDAWTSTYEWHDFYGWEHVNFSPLFGHQYTHVWIDFRNIQDDYMRQRGIDYFENSRRATLSQQAYAIDNPAGWTGYDAYTWGLTACDGPENTVITIDGEERQFHTYWARGASALYPNDDGTITPTAAGGSVPFAPEITISTLEAMSGRFGGRLYQQYGFLDSFNMTYPVEGDSVWINVDYLGIDQGPILLMIENHRTGFVWDVMRNNRYVVAGLCRAGFRGGWLEGRCNGQ